MQFAGGTRHQIHWICRDGCGKTRWLPKHRLRCDGRRWRLTTHKRRKGLCSESILQLTLYITAQALQFLRVVVPLCDNIEEPLSSSARWQHVQPHCFSLLRLWRSPKGLQQQLSLLFTSREAIQIIDKLQISQNSNSQLRSKVQKFIQPEII